MTDKLRIAVVGAGAIGGWLAARLAARGHEVCALAREATLEALNRDGLKLTENGKETVSPIKASDQASDLGSQDLVLITVKGPAVPSIVDDARTLMGKNTLLVSAMNGIPWWFSAAGLGDLDDDPIEAVDPGGSITERIPAERVIGSVVHAASGVEGPGHIRHKMGNELIFGEALGGTSNRLRDLGSVFVEAGFEVTCSRNIHADIWYKLWGNVTMNPISAITSATCDRILDDPLVNELVLQVMQEAKETGGKINCVIDESGEDRNLMTRKLGAFKTSMLQDVEAGRPLEIDAILSAPCEIARRVGIRAPAMEALLGLTRLFARSRGLYHA